MNQQVAAPRTVSSALLLFPATALAIFRYSGQNGRRQGTGQEGPIQYLLLFTNMNGKNEYSKHVTPIQNNL